MLRTVFAGYLPTAVSPDNITASVPSSTELATSKTSARVAIGLSIIDSIICVAVITTLFMLRAFLIRLFCNAGNSASPISTPKSPRATIMTSDASIISSIFSMASARSTLVTILASLPCALTSLRHWFTSAAVLANDNAT